jgi:TRAP-type transport system periplasmic protein
MRFCFLMGLVACLVASTLGFAAPARAALSELILLHSGAPGSLYDICTAEFSARVNRKLPPGYRVTVMANPQLGDGLSLIDSAKNGRATLVLASSAMVALSDSFGIFELPFLIRSRAQVRGIRPALFDRFLEPAAAKKGLHILGVWENGFRQITDSIAAIRHPQDLAGLKIAVPPGNSWRERVLRTFGAEPVPLASRALYDALRARIVDGQEAPLAEIAALRLTDDQRYLALSDHLYSPAFLVVSTAEFNALPQPVREVLAGEALAMERWIQARAAVMESNLLDTLDQRMQLSHVDTHAFETRGRPIYGEFIRAVPQGAKMIEALQALAPPDASPQELERLTLKPAR